jgi:hypothetical protein
MFVFFVIAFKTIDLVGCSRHLYRSDVHHNAQDLIFTRRHHNLDTMNCERQIKVIISLWIDHSVNIFVIHYIEDFWTKIRLLFLSLLFFFVLIHFKTNDLAGWSRLCRCWYYIMYRCRHLGNLACVSLNPAIYGPSRQQRTQRIADDSPDPQSASVYPTAFCEFSSTQKNFFKFLFGMMGERQY